MIRNNTLKTRRLKNNTMKKIKQILKKIYQWVIPPVLPPVDFNSPHFLKLAAEARALNERIAKENAERRIAEQIAERHNKYGVTLTDPRTGRDLLAGMTDEQREKYRQFLESTHRARQQKKGENKE